MEKKILFKSQECAIIEFDGEEFTLHSYIEDYHRDVTGHGRSQIEIKLELFENNATKIALYITGIQKTAYILFMDDANSPLFSTRNIPNSKILPSNFNPHDISNLKKGLYFGDHYVHWLERNDSK